ncbi:MAG: nucleotide sugar dehydrogenase [Chitinophagaceae bacterium]
MSFVNSNIIGIVGLGYVGLPLACLFAKKYTVVGYDIDENKISLLQKGIDYTQELSVGSLQQKSIQFTNSINHLQICSVIIVTVPTDITSSNEPDLFPLKNASAQIGAILQKGMTIVFESTVYPGLTEEVCIPILETTSGLVWKKDFFVGYSPERVNPGDKNRPIESILKIISGDTAATVDKLNNLYSSVIDAGIYIAPNIKVAEAAKVIENAQRDLNIAFMNELALIFDKMQIDTRDVLKAAATKWNFLPFEPGLVGGHCIGVDPYYLTHKAEQLGYSPQVIHSGRHVNNQMGKFIADKVLKALIAKRTIISSSRVLILGCTFKENVSDCRNSKVFDIVNTLTEYEIQVDVVDPLANKLNALQQISESIAPNVVYDAIILAVKHQIFQTITLSYLQTISANNSLYLFDVKAMFAKQDAEEIATFYWRM